MTTPGRETQGVQALLSRWCGWVALLWAAAFFYLGVSAAPPVPEVAGLERVDLVGHAAASGLLSLLVAEWLVIRRGTSKGISMAAGLAAGAGLGAVIEVVQLGSSVRSFEGLDFFADLVGAAVGVWLHSSAADRVRPRSRFTVTVTLAGLVASLVTAIFFLLW